MEERESGRERESKRFKRDEKGRFQHQRRGERESGRFKEEMRKGYFKSREGGGRERDRD